MVRTNPDEQMHIRMCIHAQSAVVTTISLVLLTASGLDKKRQCHYVK